MQSLLSEELHIFGLLAIRRANKSRQFLISYPVMFIDIFSKCVKHKVIIEFK
jgi:hypothetical protein